MSEGWLHAPLSLNAHGMRAALEAAIEEAWWLGMRMSVAVLDAADGTERMQNG